MATHDEPAKTAEIDKTPWMTFSVSCLLLGGLSVGWSWWMGGTVILLFGQMLIIIAYGCGWFGWQLRREINARQNMLAHLTWLKQSLAATDQGIAVLDSQGQCQYANAALAKLLGQGDPLALLGRSFHEMVHHRHPDGSTFPQHECPLSKLQHTTQALHIALDTFWTADQQPVAVTYHAYPFWHHHTYQGVLLWLGRAEESNEIQRRLRLLTHAVEQSFTIIMITDVKGRIEYANPAFSRVTGYDLKEIQGKTPAILKSGVQTAEFYHTLWKTLLTGQVWQGEFINRRKNGELYYEVSTISPVCDSHQAISHFVAVGADMSEQKQAEMQLRESETRYRTVIEAMSEGVMVHSTQGRIIACNRAAATIFGLSKRQLLGKMPQEIGWDMMYEDGSPYPDKEHPALQTLRNGKAIQGAMMGVRRAPNHTIWLLLHTQPLFYQHQSHPYAVVATFTDITHRKQLEEALRRSEAKIRQLGDNLPQGALYQVVIQANQQRRFTYISAGIERIFGLSAKAILADASLLYSKVLPSEINGLIKAENESLEKLTYFDYEFRIKGLDNTEHWMHCRSSPQRLNDKEVQWNGVVMDITARKQAEEQLRENKRRLQMALRAAQAGTFYYDAISGINEWDERSLEIFGVSPASFTHDFQAWQQRVHPEDLAQAEQQFWQAWQEHTIFDSEYRIIRPDGEVRHIRAQAYITCNEDHQAVRASGLHFDVSAQKQVEEELIAARHAAEEANRAKSVFLTNISHEIRTPMNAILGFSELLHQELANPRLRSYLETIRNSGQNLLHLIEDILDLSKIEANQFKPCWEAVNIYQLLEQIQTLFSLKAAEKKLNWEVIIDPGVPQYVTLDSILVRQIVTNLVGNALKFTKQGFVHLYATSEPEQNKKTVGLRLVVADSGRGIALAEQEKVFHAFQQVEEGDSRQYGGTGLGLTITRKLCQLLGGSISLESNLGQGSRFTVSLPNIRLAQGTPQATDSPKFDLTRFQFAPALVLSVDDVASNQALIQAYLTPCGLRVQLVENGALALAFLQQHKPAIILMDLWMPHMNGYETTKAIRANPAWTEIPIVALSASLTDITHDQAVANGFNGLLCKPIKQPTLVKMLAEFLPLQSHVEVLLPAADQSISLLSSAAATELRERFYPLWESAHKNHSFSEIDEFARQLAAFGKQHHHAKLCHYGEQLSASAQSFDIVLINELLAQFPLILTAVSKKT